MTWHNWVNFEDPSIEFTTPIVGLTAEASFARTGNDTFGSATTSKLIITITNGTMEDQQLHVFTITMCGPGLLLCRPMKPVYERLIHQACIDNGTHQSIDVGTPRSASFVTTTDTPGFLDTATVTFTTAGRVQARKVARPQTWAMGCLAVRLGFESSAVSVCVPSSATPPRRFRSDGNFVSGRWHASARRGFGSFALGDDDDTTTTEAPFDTTTTEAPQSPLPATFDNSTRTLAFTIDFEMLQATEYVAAVTNAGTVFGTA